MLCMIKYVIKVITYVVHDKVCCKSDKVCYKSDKVFCKKKDKVCCSFLYSRNVHMHDCICNVSRKRHVNITKSLYSTEEVHRPITFTRQFSTINAHTVLFILSSSHSPSSVSPSDMLVLFFWRIDELLSIILFWSHIKLFVRFLTRPSLWTWLFWAWYIQQRALSYVCVDEFNMCLLNERLALDNDKLHVTTTGLSGSPLLYPIIEEFLKRSNHTHVAKHLDRFSYAPRCNIIFYQWLGVVIQVN